jgi:hypothetical protein
MQQVLQVFFFMVVVLGIWLMVRQTSLVRVKSRTDGRSYLVQDFPDKQAAADLIGTLMKKVDTLLAALKDSDDPDFQRLLAGFKPSSVQENVQTSSYTSYTENKGEAVVLCLRKKDSSNALLHPDLLIFVFIHELGHIMTEESDEGSHGPTFWMNFKKLLGKAVELGLYTPVDYSKHPEPYCGIEVTDSPLYGKLPSGD